MDYPKKSVNGHAGEYFVAYSITRLLGWPCRLFGVDIGVDAELEIMTDSGSSTGDVIKIQVKSFEEISSATSKSLHVDDRHIDYWKRFCLPVIICCVDLKAGKVYWTQILSTEAYLSGEKSRKISIDLSKDELSVSSKSALRLLAIPESSKQIQPLFLQLDALYAQLESRGTPYCVDGDELVDYERSCAEINAVAEKIENLISHFPWRASAMDLRNLQVTRRNTQIILNDANHSFSANVNGM